MTALKIILGVFLFFNVAAVSIILTENNAELISYFNLLGSVLFGYYIKDISI